MARWINSFEVVCPDPEREKEWIDWYKTIHAPDILKTPGFLTARLFERKEYRDGRGQFFTVYDIETDDIDKTIVVRQKNRDREIKTGRGSTAVFPVWKDVVWKQIKKGESDNKRDPELQRWINLVEVNCVDATKETDFNDWYNNIHLPDVLETPGFVAATRYEMKEFRDGRAKYLAIYELETSNIENTMAVRREKWIKEKEQGRQSNLWIPVWRNVLWRMLFELIK